MSPWAEWRSSLFLINLVKSRSKNYFLVLILWLTNNKKGGGGGVGVGARYKWSKKITFGKNSSMQKKKKSDQGD